MPSGLTHGDGGPDGDLLNPDSVSIKSTSMSGLLSPILATEIWRLLAVFLH